LVLRLLVAVLFVGTSALLTNPLRAQTSTTLDTADVRRWREDLTFLRKEMPAHHTNLFHEMSRAQFDSALNSIDAIKAPLTFADYVAGRDPALLAVVARK
jgi:hypothetical protein